jgi:hypothetical protein
MKQINNTKYYIMPCGAVARLLKPRKKGNINYWNLSIDGKLKAYSQKTIDNLLNHDKKAL